MPFSTRLRPEPLYLLPDTWQQGDDMSQIKINKKKDHFFIAIGKQKEHSFVMLGVYDKTRVTHLLCRVGKIFDTDLAPEEITFSIRFRELFKAIFFATKAKIVSERISSSRKGSIPISYQAYEMRYEQYVEFVQLLEGLQTETNKFKCYKPIHESNDEAELALTTDIVFTVRNDLDVVKKGTEELGIANTCRHTAMKLVQDTLHSTQGSQVSNLFFMDLPYKTTLEYGVPGQDIPFYVLPPAPGSFSELSLVEQGILVKIYQRMEELLEIDTHSILTQNKFENLKVLYHQISSFQGVLPLDELLGAIKLWKKQNKSSIAELRETYFWDIFFTRESATSKLIHEIELDLDDARLNQYRDMCLVNDNFKGGLELKFVADAEFESLNETDPSQNEAIFARNALRLLMMGWPAVLWRQFLCWQVFKAIFIQRAPSLLKELRFAFQEGFELLFTQLKGQTLNAQQGEQVQLYISNCLSLLPYSDLTPYESIKIPQYINEEWMLIEYQVTPIELTPTQGFKSFFIQDKDRVFAYGLEPILHKDAQPHLIFMGTTYPAGQGFVPQIETDLEGFKTAGKSLYKSGKGRIKGWLAKQNHKVHVCGVSLGGSLSLLLALHQGNYLQRVDALNPFGLHDSFHKPRHNKWTVLEEKPMVVIQQQADDPISSLGVWKEEWLILKVNPPADKKGPNGICDHFQNYAGFAETEFRYADAAQENAQRHLRNFWLYSVGRSIVYYSLTVPYVYLLRPVLYFMVKNWLTVTVSVLSLVVGATLALLTYSGVFPLFVLSGFLLTSSIAAGVYIALQSASALNGAVMSPPIANIHSPHLARNPSMDIYNKDHAIEVTLTGQQVSTYYRVMRCLLKQKDFLPTEEQSEHVDGTLSKRELLLASENSANNEIPMSVKTTKAKAIHIHRVLTLVEQMGVVNDHELKTALEESYQQYRVGKIT